MSLAFLYKNICVFSSCVVITVINFSHLILKKLFCYFYHCLIVEPSRNCWSIKGDVFGEFPGRGHTLGLEIAVGGGIFSCKYVGKDIWTGKKDRQIWLSLSLELATLTTSKSLIISVFVNIQLKQQIFCLKYLVLF